MNLNELKDKLLMWKDFYGQDIADTDSIEQATNRGEIREVLEKHQRFLENQAIDAQTDIGNFIQELDLDYI